MARVGVASAAVVGHWLRLVPLPRVLDRPEPVAVHTAKAKGAGVEEGPAPRQGHQALPQRGQRTCGEKMQVEGLAAIVTRRSTDIG